MTARTTATEREHEVHTPMTVRQCSRLCVRAAAAAHINTNRLACCGHRPSHPPSVDSVRIEEKHNVAQILQVPVHTSGIRSRELENSSQGQCKNSQCRAKYAETLSGDAKFDAKFYFAL